MAETAAGLEIPIGITDKKALQAVVRLVSRSEQELRKLEKTAATTNSGIAGSFGRMSRQSRASLQNVSYQFQDIFVQISSGQGAARALGQQLPQLLSGFGAFGAVLGLVASAAIPLAANFLGADKAAGTLKERIDALNSAIGDYDKALANATVTTGDLVKKYGTATTAAREFLAALLEIQQVEAVQALDSQMASIATRFGDLSQISAEAVRGQQGPGAYSAAIEEFDALRSQLDLTTTQALALVDAMQAMGSASGAKEQVAAAQELQSLMLQVLGPVEDMTASQRAFYEEIVESGNAAADLVGSMDQAANAADGVAGAASGIAPVIDDASAAAANLTANLGAAMAQLNAVVAGVQAAQRQALATARIKLETVGDPEGRAAGMARQDYLEKSGTAAYAAIRSGSTAGLETISGQATAIAEGARQVAAAEEAVSQAEAAYQATVRASSSGGGGGRKSGGGGGKRSGGGGRSAREEKPFFEDIEKDLVQLERQIELIGKSNEQVAEAKARWELLDEAKKRGLTVNPELNAQIDAQAAAVGRLTGELERAEIAQEQFDQAIDGIADAMAGALVAGESLREGLAQVFKQIAADILSSGIREALMGLFGGGGGGLLSGLLGSSGSSAPSFDGGGFTGGGARSGGIDGKGGFPAILHPNETVIDHTRGQTAGGGQTSIVVSLSPELEARILEQAGQQSVQVVQSFSRDGLPQKVSEIMRNPRSRG